MSSILKALKKLENEVPDKNDIRLGPHQFYAKKAIQKRVKSDFFFNKYVLIIFTFIILIIGGGLVLTFKPRKKQPTTTSIAEIKPKSKAVNRLEKKSRTPALQQKDTLSLKDKEKFELAGKAVKKPLLSSHRFRKEEPELSVKIENEPTELIRVPEEKPFFEQSLKKKPFANRNEKESEQKIDSHRFASIPIRQASESLLKLQAIAWSGNPEKRIAVINGHIVREGESVERATVKHIGKNTVVFKKGSEEWRQVFRVTSNF